MIPQIKLETMHSILASGLNESWLKTYCDRLLKEQPVLNNYLATAKELFGSHAAMVGIMVYRMIESQMEAQELEDLFDNDEPFAEGLFDDIT